jgi:putative spermidine/putrescine transport system permease protein
MGKVVRIVAIVLLAYVALPMFVVLVSSFSSGNVLSFPPTGLSLEPYASLLSNPDIRAGLARSFIVGTMVVAFSLIAGIPATLALYRYRVRLRPVFFGFILLGVSTPLIASSFAFLIIFTRLKVFGALWPIAVALTVVNLPFLMFSLISALAQSDPQMEEAAATLGAERIQTFLFVTLPALMPGILTGSIMVFVLGITDFLVSLLLTTASSQTLPIVIFGSLRGPVRPIFAAASGIYVVIALVVVLAITQLRATGQFLYREE